MIGAPDTGLARTTPEANQSIPTKRAVVGVSVGAGTYGILVASLCSGSER
jgi:hypothetical protein